MVRNMDGARVHPVNLGLGPIMRPEASYSWHYGPNASDVEDTYIGREYLVRVECEHSFFHKPQRDLREVARYMRHMGGDELVRLMVNSLITFCAKDVSALDFASLLLDTLEE